ncbi:hypothetical protein E2562_001621 [Oryza meyeriana var. granulata]|uniref:RING-type domain-containing protein n=1 Tax=Oryza meyeriana var. granulata TaxID=110450 RepID=A0A6G1CE68_9ORYZ|nr:hypothetical protein E2562_001621 [Oryza meyeriana var. granulata]
MEVGSVLLSLLFAAFSLPCLLLLLVLAEAGLRLASLALRGGRYSWPTRSDFLGYRIARGGHGHGHGRPSSAGVGGGRFSYPLSGTSGGGGGGVGVGGMHKELLPPERCDRLAVAVYRRGRDAPPVDCVFCLSRVDDGEEVRELRCRHVFHRACLDGWLVRPRATCPLCRDCLLPSSPPRNFPLDYYDDDDDVHFGFNDFSITSSSSSTTTSSSAAAVAYPHGVALWPM